jgi:hypothetical protein
MFRVTWIVALAVCTCATALLAGTLDYGVRALVTFGVALSLALVTGWRVARAFGAAGIVEGAITSAVASLAVIVVCMMAAGAFGYLTVAAVLAAHAVTASCTFFGPARRWETVPFCDAVDIPVSVIALVLSLMVFAVAFGIWHSPLTLYDSLSYHLYFAARWIQDHAITIIPTPFSDVAQAYAPGNGELWFAWLMLPFHGDLLARMGQLPFALLGAAAIFGVGRRLGVAGTHAVYPSAFYLFSRPVFEQMIGANVDLICAALFMCAVYFAIAAAESRSRAPWLLFGVSTGLFAGTKYVALVYVPILIALACARGLHVRALWALPGLMVFGASWYLRNWIVAGSPIYPATLAVGGFTIARGAFDRAAMLNTVFHTSDVRLLPALAAHAFGPTLFVVWLPCAAIGWTRMVRHGWWPAGALAVLPLAMTPFYWFGFPVNVDTRFLLPAIGPAMLPLAFVFASNRRWNTVVHVAYALSLVWIIVGVSSSLPGTLPWFMSGWLALAGLVNTPFLAWFAVTASGIGIVWLVARRSPAVAVPVLTLAVSIAGTAVTLGATAWCGRGNSCEYLQTTSPFIRAGYLASWQWIDHNVSGATIAYTGINLPYPLTGRQLANRVVYANIDGRQKWRFHDYDRAYRTGRFSPRPPLLASSSGELMPVADRSGPRQDALRPRYDRMDGNREAWLFNLETMRVRYLFVAMLSAYEVDYQWHDRRGFPIEDEWAHDDQAHFRLAYENPQVRIYEFTPEGRVNG